MAIIKRFRLIYIEDGLVKRREGLSIGMIIDIVNFTYPDKVVKKMNEMDVGGIVDSGDFTIVRVA